LSFCDKKDSEKKTENIFGEIKKNSKAILEREKKNQENF